MFLVHFESLGCRLNQNETEALADAFLQAGFGLFDTAKNPDDVLAVFVNTCTVTGKAEQKCRRAIRACAKKFPHALILVSGCYAQLESSSIEAISPAVKTFPGMQKGLLAQFPKYFSEKLHAVSPAVIKIFPQCALEIFSRFKTEMLPQNTAVKISVEQSSRSTTAPTPKMDKTHLQEKPAFAFDLTTRNFAFHSRASLKIQDGCNSACTFCRIHLARGKSVSLDVDEAVARAKKIEAAGKNEIVLTGVNLAQYVSGNFRFPQLLKKLLEHTDHVKFRISSFYPEAITADFLEVIKSDRVCPYFHLSVQSGSERILQLMKRPADTAQIYAACEGLRSVKDNPFLGADIITGFPTETEEDFAKTAKLCRDLAFAHIHSFPFSPRPGTPAYTFKPKVPERIARERVNFLNTISAQNYAAYLESVNGKTVTGIVETFKTGKKILTENYLLLPLKYGNFADNLKSGECVTVKIIGDCCELC